MSSEGQHIPHVQGEIDARSIPGHPDYTPPDVFAQQLSPATDLTHGEGPEVTVSAISYDAVAEHTQAVEQGKGGVYGGLGMAMCLGARVLIDKLSPAVDNKALGDALHAIGDHGTALTMILCGTVIVTSTVRTEIHRMRARKAQAHFERTLKPDTQ